MTDPVPAEIGEVAALGIIRCAVRLELR